MVSYGSAAGSPGALPPDVGGRVDAGEGVASFPLHLDTWPPQLLQHAFPPEPAAVVGACVPAEPGCTVPDAYAAIVDVGAHPSPSLQVPPWGDSRFPPQLPSWMGLSAFRTFQTGLVVPKRYLHCKPVSFHRTDLKNKRMSLIVTGT